MGRSSPLPERGEAPGTPPSWPWVAGVPTSGKGFDLGMPRHSRCAVRPSCPRLGEPWSACGAMWQRHRALVEAATWPEPFRSFLIKENGKEPDDTDMPLEDWERAISADLPERLLHKAEQLAKIWKRHPPKPRGVLA